MNWMRQIFGRRRICGELSEEIRAHLEEKVEELVAGGTPREEAVHASRRQFGNVLLAEERSREVWRWPRLENFLINLRYALRVLRKSPGFAAVALVTLAVATGANTAVFSVVESVLLKPLPYPHSSQLVAIWQTAPGATTPLPLELGPSNYFVYREQSHVFQNIGLYENDSVSVTGIGQPEQVHALDVTQSVLPILGIPPAVGRWFGPGADTPGAPEMAMLAYGYWRSKFGGDPGVIGQTIVLDGVAHQIIGVMPERFHFLDEPDIALILPLRLDRNHTVLGQFHYYGIGRLKPGVTLAEANADLARLIPIVLRSFPAPPGYSPSLFYNLRLGPDVHPLRQDVVGGVGKLLWILMGGVGLVLLIACANIANLLLVRTQGRQHELTIRSALGATRAMGGHTWKDALWTSDSGSGQTEVPPIRTYVFASPEYLQTMNIPLVAGRNFTWTETYSKEPVALVSQSLAREYWGDAAAAIGKRVRASNTDEWREVIGVVGDVREAGMNKPACECVYWPLYATNLDGNQIVVANDVSFVVRTARAGSQAFLDEVRRAVWFVDPDLPLTDVHTMGFFYRKSMERTSFTLLMLGIAGGMAFLLAILGLYGVIAYSVSQRTCEIGIRTALGARPRELVRMFQRQGLLLAAVGVGCGLVVALGVTRLLSSLLFHVGSADPLTYLAAGAGLVAAACIAGYVPARRATRDARRPNDGVAERVSAET